mgnify:CR=1 FL=1
MEPRAVLPSENRRFRGMFRSGYFFDYVHLLVQYLLKCFLEIQRGVVSVKHINFKGGGVDFTPAQREPK